MKVKRIYDPYQKSDGYRVLVDRLWPRGLTREDANIDAWIKGAAPSGELRKWYHQNKETRFKVFCEDYLEELSDNQAFERLKKIVQTKKTVTLLTASKVIETSHIPTLLKALED